MKFEVECLGIFYAESSDDVVSQCIEELREHNLWTHEYMKYKLAGKFTANQVNY